MVTWKGTCGYRVCRAILYNDLGCRSSHLIRVLFAMLKAPLICFGDILLVHQLGDSHMVAQLQDRAEKVGGEDAGAPDRFSEQNIS